MDELLTGDLCTLPTAERPLRLAELEELFASSLVALVVDDDGVRMRLRGDHGLRNRVLDLTARETACCSFFRFAVGGSETDVELTISVPLAQQHVLDALAARAADVAGVVVPAAAGGAGSDA